ncbi:Histone-lysine N-methyltransferase SETMAR [Eufriesea mexicana]|uniref:Histone-lysine N-methyltransferase SETMAR n=1 Tax=Eufriesea mexicana TaxID=516756 RepID=A0A310SW03_9HYME|nr:Histone-lysine N-methyltransferase SETMAR [Eufriesea mexicana]
MVNPDGVPAHGSPDGATVAPLAPMNALIIEPTSGLFYAVELRPLHRGSDVGKAQRRIVPKNRPQALQLACSSAEIDNRSLGCILFVERPLVADLLEQTRTRQQRAGNGQKSSVPSIDYDDCEVERPELWHLCHLYISRTRVRVHGAPRPGLGVLSSIRSSLAPSRSGSGNAEVAESRGSIVLSMNVDKTPIDNKVKRVECDSPRRLTALSKYVSLVTKSLLKSFSTPFNMDSQKKHLQHVTLRCFKKGSSAKGTADEICTVYGSGTTTIRNIRNWFKKFRAGNFDLKDEARSGRPETTDTDLVNFASKSEQFWKEDIMRLPEGWKKVMVEVGLFMACFCSSNESDLKDVGLTAVMAGLLFLDP